MLIATRVVLSMLVITVFMTSIESIELVHAQVTKVTKVLLPKFVKKRTLMKITNPVK